MKIGTIYPVQSWTLHKAKRIVLSIGAAEILAAGEEIDEGKLLARSVSNLFHVDLLPYVGLESKDLFTLLKTHRNAIGKYLRADVNLICYEFERKKVNRFI